MIPPHTVFLLQFAKYHPECTRKAVAPSPVTTESAVQKNPPERRASTLRRMLGIGETLPTRG